MVLRLGSNCVCLWVFAPAAACGRRGPLEKSTTAVPRRPAAAPTQTHKQHQNTKEGNYQKNKPLKNANKSLFTNRMWGSGKASRRISPSLQCKSRQQILLVDVSIDSARACSTYVEEAGSEVACSRSLQRERLPDKHDKEKTTSNEERTRREQGRPKVPRGREGHAKERRKKMQGGRAKKKKKRKHAQSN